MIDNNNDNNSNLHIYSNCSLNILKYLENLARDFKSDSFLATARISNMNYATPLNTSVVDFLNSLITLFRDNNPRYSYGRIRNI